MRNTRFTVVARLAFCGFLLLLGLNGTGAASEEKGIAITGSVYDNRPFIEPSDAYCESDCCWAYCWGYEDCSVECSSSGCSAQGGDESAKVTCDQT